MTKKFDIFVEQLLKSFDDLPDYRPYGFWIGPNGQIYKVGNMLHEYVAEKIIDASESLNTEYKETTGSIKDFLVKKGFVRTVFSGDYMLADNSYYDWNTHKYIKADNTNVCKKTVKDISLFYNKQLHYTEL